MRSYRLFILIFGVLLTVYVIAELNRPKPLSWKVTLSKDDKNPYGAFILFDRLEDLFPGSSVIPLREPAYNLLHDKKITNAAYVAVAPNFKTGETDLKELLKFAEQGNHVFISAEQTSEAFLDTLGITIDRQLLVFEGDSTSINFVNPSLRSPEDYRYRKLTVDEYFSELRKDDSTIILGISNKEEPNLIKVKIGKGAFFIHAAPLVFSNHSMLFNNNHEYVAKAFSYIPATVSTVYWDEYYKLGRTGPTTPLRFFLSNEWLRWALRLTIAALILYVLFEMKRRQRIIPVIEPLRNTTLDFVKTVSAVYLAQRDNRSIANNKIQYWLHYIRRRYYLQTTELNDEFVMLLAKRSGADELLVKQLLDMIRGVQSGNKVTDEQLLRLNQKIEAFYNLSKT